MPDYVLLPGILKHNVHRGRSSSFMPEDANPYFKVPPSTFRIVLAPLNLC